MATLRVELGVSLNELVIGFTQYDPIEEEIERVLAENPGLLGRLQGWARRFAAPKAQREDLLTTEEVRRRLGLAPNRT